MTVGYVLRRIGVFFVIVWAAASFNFILPRLTGVNPVEEQMMQMAANGGAQAGNMENYIHSYEKRFGLDKPLWEQYLVGMKNTAEFQFGFSIAFFPASVMSIVLHALPWSIGLLVTAVLLNFVIGVFLGALVAWPRAPAFVKNLIPPLMALSAIPYYLLGIALLYVLAFVLGWFPIGGGYSLGLTPGFSLGFIGNAAKHAILPALAIVLSAMGVTALGMRGMMVTTLGEDYMVLGRAKGLRGWRLFIWYGVRNAILPQVTQLALSLGLVVSGAILVEVVFSYPGVGGILYQAIRSLDYTLIFGIVYIIVLAIALATLILDLAYPRLDPRISYKQE